MELIGLLASLGAALSWTFSSLISPKPTRELGAFAFNRVRQLVVFVILGIAAVVLGTWDSLSNAEITILVISGFIGIFIGDTALFATMARWGPRRTQMIFATHAPMTVVLGVVIFQESLTIWTAFGSALVVLGTWIAIAYGKRRDQLHIWEQIRGPVWIGLAFGLIAALGQAVGVLISKPVMQAGADPVVAAAIRVGTAGFCLSILRAFPMEMFKSKKPLTPRLFFLSALSGFLGLALGMSLYMTGLAYTSAGNVAVLTSTVPVLLLPFLWLITKERPAAMAWIGALSAVVGAALIFAG